MAKIIIPTPLRKFTGNQASFETPEAGSVGSTITALTEQYPDIKRHLIDENGDLRAFVRVYVGDEDINEMDGSDTAVAADTVISIIPAIAGGVQ